MKKIFYTVFLALAVTSMQAQAVKDFSSPAELTPAQKASRGISEELNPVNYVVLDIVSAAKTLKISEEKLEIALADSSSNLKTAAKKLNVPLSELQTALGFPG